MCVCVERYKMPACNIWPKCRVIMSKREERTTELRPLPVVKGIVWFSARSKTQEENEAEVHRRSFCRNLSTSLGIYKIAFQTDILVYAILTYVYEIQTTTRSDKCINICYYNQAALRTPRPTKITPHWNDKTKGAEWHFYSQFRVT